MAEKLNVTNLSKRFRGVSALIDVCFDVKDGEIFSIIGPNGAGKTTIFNCISGFQKPSGGRISFDGLDITGMKPFRIAQAGVGRTFQNLALFKGLTVLDNIKLGAEIHLDYGLLSAVVFYSKARRTEVGLRKEIEEKIIDLLEIESIRHKVAGTLAYGLQKRVELARALAMKPKLLLLDEPTAGMNAEETHDMARYILDISEEFRMPIVLIEHDMGIVMGISDRIMVLDFGEIIAHGLPAEIAKNPKVVKAYLGNVEEQA